jgi:hypothetical protein
VGGGGKKEMLLQQKGVVQRVLPAYGNKKYYTQ